MTTALGRGVKLEVALTFAAAKTVTALTLASPGVATSAAHGMANGTVGYWAATGGGMPQIDGQATRVYNQATNTFELQGLNTSSYSAWASGTFTPVATWGTLSEAVSFDTGGAGAERLDDTRLIDVVKQEIIGLLASDSITVGVKPQTYSGTVMQLIKDASIAQTYQVYRLTLQDGSVMVARGLPSRPSFSLQQGQLASGSFQIAVKGFVLDGQA